VGLLQYNHGVVVARGHHTLVLFGHEAEVLDRVLGCGWGGGGARRGGSRNGSRNGSKNGSRNVRKGAGVGAGRRAGGGQLAEDDRRCGRMCHGKKAATKRGTGIVCLVVYATLVRGLLHPWEVWDANRQRKRQTARGTCLAVVEELPEVLLGL
jgi:hypothetical protein